jgi:hypothetical protein
MTISRHRARGRSGDIRQVGSKAGPPEMTMREGPENMPEPTPEPFEPEPYDIAPVLERIDGLAEMVGELSEIVGNMPAPTPAYNDRRLRDGITDIYEHVDALFANVQDNATAVRQLRQEFASALSTLQGFREDVRNDIAGANERQTRAIFAKPEQPPTVCHAEPLHCKAEPLVCKAQPMPCGFGQDKALHDKVDAQQLQIDVLYTSVNSLASALDHEMAELTAAVSLLTLTLNKPSMWRRLLMFLRIVKR